VSAMNSTRLTTIGCWIFTADASSFAVNLTLQGAV